MKLPIAPKTIPRLIRSEMRRNLWNSGLKPFSCTVTPRPILLLEVEGRQATASVSHNTAYPDLKEAAAHWIVPDGLVEQTFDKGALVAAGCRNIMVSHVPNSRSR